MCYSTYVSRFFCSINVSTEQLDTNNYIDINRNNI